jgi:hypothetical protein
LCHQKIGFALLFTVSLTRAQSFVDLHGPLMVDGTRIVDKNGETIVLRGMCLSWHQWEAKPLWSYDVIKWLRDKASIALNKELCLFVTEWGTSTFGEPCRNDGSQCDFPESQRWLDFLEANSIGSANWSVCNKDECTSVLKPGLDNQGNGGWTEDMLTPSGTWVRNLLTEKNATAFDKPQTLVKASAQSGGRAF